MSELKPCPFCNSAEGVIDYENMLRQLGKHCLKCDTIVIFTDLQKDEVDEKWNHRPTLNTEPPEDDHKFSKECFQNRCDECESEACWYWKPAPGGRE